MSTALYRRYRPDSFEQVIGQDHVTVPLRAALGANKVTHAYLFSGPRGCGKTTSARILARCLNCAQGPTSTPCGTCDSCRELATGGPGSLDVVEIDAASHGGVDDARELRERATFAPVRDRYKVFIIDEAHMVTQAGFNALLKLVEEPPEHVKFVFATTEPDKVLGTIRSRTHHYPFRLVPPDVLEPYLGHLAAGEGVDIAAGVLNLVIRAGGGSVRDTLSVLDQLMAGAVDGHLPYSQAVALLGYTDVALLDESVDALAGGDGAAVYRVVERMVDSGHDPRRFVEDLLQRLRDLLIISVAGDGAVDVLTGVPADQLERMMTQARNWGPRALSHAADLTDKALRSMVGATSPRLQLELLIGRILVPAVPAVPAEAVQGAVGLAGGGAPHERPLPQGGQASGAPFGAAQAKERLRAMRAGGGEADAAPQGVSDPGVSVGSGAPAGVVPFGGSASASAPVQEVSSPSWGASAPAWEAAVPQAPAASASSVPAPPAQAPAGPEPAQASTSAAPPSASAVHSGGGNDADMLRQRWPEVIERLSSISRVAWALLNGNGQLGGVDGRQAVVVLPTQGMVDAFVNGQRGPHVEQAIYEATGLRLSVIAQVGQAQGGAPVTTPTASAAQVRIPQAGTESTPVVPAASTPEQESGAQVTTASWGVDATSGAAGHRSVEVKHESPFRDATPSGETVGMGQSGVFNGLYAQQLGAEDPQSPAPVHEVHAEPAPESAPAPAVEHLSAPAVDAEAAPAEDVEPDPAVQPTVDIAWPTPAVVPAPQPEDDHNRAQDHPGTPTLEPTPASAHMWEAYGQGAATWTQAPTPAATVTFSDEDTETDRPSRRPHLEVISNTQAGPAEEEEHVSAADDDSASIDDEDLEMDMTIGLDAVKEILGATVISENVDESAW